MMRVSTAVASLFAGLIVLGLSACSGNVFTGVVALMVATVSFVYVVASRRFDLPAVPPLVCAFGCLAALAPLTDWSVWNAGYLGGAGVWNHVEGAGIWLTVFPMSYMVMALVSKYADGRYNRFLAYGFSALLSIGSLVLVWVAVSVFCFPDLDTKYTFTQESAFLFTDCILSFATACIAVRHLNGSGMAVERREGE